ncbi:MAG: DUF6825 family protein [Limnoraphis robusta]|jgi:vacuolar-type H+-ATPase subunit E/Vma4|uniref:Thylakoid lumen protein n=1 Tax=Limnoraphis robusta CCNP1315 TaxID=3110306 RepID=A0ABU5U1P1_9CYAN|nr:hypothetical protein [Limnoraphis robusta]MCG5061537.1 hypothetical protein [Limnoraphis sp. WC205]MEA5521108.1 hypothetical protein [Limnoraphis robusta CCNP1315]MEA5547331.1 hypothetical protein [Limnoraphis robusta CCNP1324]
MSKPSVDAFFVGRAVAEGLYEQLENILTNALSELGKFDAEQRERLRQFTDQVLERANLEAQMTHQGTSSSVSRSNSQSIDLQATIDELRAEVAELRSELQRYRNRNQ